MGRLSDMPKVPLLVRTRDAGSGGQAVTVFLRQSAPAAHSPSPVLSRVAFGCPRQRLSLLLL